MRLIKIMLSILLAACLLYLGAYGLSTWQEEKKNQEMAQAVSSLREEMKTPAASPVPTAAKMPSSSPVPSLLPHTPLPSSAPAAAPTLASVASPTCAPTATVAPVFSPPPSPASGLTPLPVPPVASTPLPTPAESPLPAVPTTGPTAAPSADPIAEPTATPTLKPTAAPAADPTPEATAVPTFPITPGPTPFPSPIPPTPDPLLAYYGELAQKNADMIGWIHIPDTKIDYPVMYRPEEKNYYLHRGFDRNYAFEGLPFLDERCDLSLPSDNLILYGHNMKNGTLFGCLKDYLKKDHYDAHPLIYFDTLTERGIYRIFAVIPIVLAEMEDERMACYAVSMTEDQQQIQSLQAYVERYAEHFSLDALPQVGDQVITLSTCTGFRDANRLVVMAARIGKQKGDMHHAE